VLVGLPCHPAGVNDRWANNTQGRVSALRTRSYTRFVTASVLAAVLVAGGSAGAGAAEPDDSQPGSGLPAQVDASGVGAEAQDDALVEEAPEASVDPASPELSVQPDDALVPEQVQPPTGGEPTARTVLPPPPVTTQTVVNKTTLSTRYTDKSRQISRCTVYTTGGTCSISKGKSATRTIQTSLGITRNAVASSLSISAASTVSLTASCNSPVLKSGQS
jgi:hypothetical protein